LDQPKIEGWEAPPRREPLFRAPWTIVALGLTLIGLYAAQTLLMPESEVAAWGVTPGALAAGRWQTLLTSLFLHGSWPHVLMNSVAVIAFGPPVARLMGLGPRGAATFFAFYLICGMLSGLGFAAADALFVAKHVPAVGASGAVSGLLGAASRLIQGRGRVGPMFGRTVLAWAAAWTLVNVVFGVSGLTPGAEGSQVAWQAHLAGYAAGVLLVGPFARLAGRDATWFTQ
jgi:membrane associated rhomboid family serine protease